MHDPGRAELLLERDRELESLRRALADAVAGEGRLALVDGPAEIGKSRLLGELRAAAEEEGVRVLAARGSELEGEFPFGVVRQLFEPALHDAEAREHWLDGAAAPARRSSRPPSSATSCAAWRTCRRSSGPRSGAPIPARTRR